MKQFSILLVVLVWVGCSSEETTTQLSAADRFALGAKKFQHEDYLEAIEDFKVVTLQYQGSRVADSAQFYMGECRYRREEYVLAAYEYEVLIRTMPTSKLVPKARFRRATCYYDLSPEASRDQEYTKKAIDEYQAFIEYYPTDTLVTTAEQRIAELNTKLARKDFDNAMTYMNMEYFKAAAVYFDQVLEKYHDTPYAEPALLKKAEALYDRHKFADALAELQKFFQKYPDSKLRDEAERLRVDVTTGLNERAARDSTRTSVSTAPKSIQSSEK